jgi:hypothetical protein
MQTHIQSRKDLIKFNVDSNNIEEYELVRELNREKEISYNDEISNDYIYDEIKNGIIDFLFNFNKVGENIEEKRYDSIVKIECDNKNDDYKIKINFEIGSSRRFDIVQEIYLIVDFKHIDDYENTLMKSDFLNSQINFTIGSKKIFETSLLMCILESKLK